MRLLENTPHSVLSALIALNLQCPRKPSDRDSHSHYIRNTAASARFESLPLPPGERIQEPSTGVSICRDPL